MSQTRAQQRFSILEVAANWHELMMLLCIMWPSIVCGSKQLDPWSTQRTHNTPLPPISHSRLSPCSL